MTRVALVAAEIDGAIRWRIDADACFRYWNLIGTDCGLCMKLCPYSHPRAFVHSVVRTAIKRSPRARRS